MQTEVITTDNNSLVLREPQRQAVAASDFFPLFTVDQAVQRKSQVNQFIQKVMVDGQDYGKMPGGREDKILLKPGAEKLCSIFGLSVTYAEDKIIEDWTGEDHGGEPLFYYSYRCQLSRGGLFMGESIGSCNSWETKYRYRWVTKEIAELRSDFDRLPKRGGRSTKFEPHFALEKKEMTGKYGKPAEYWAAFENAIQDGTAKSTEKKMGARVHQGWEITVDELQFRIPNPEVADVINTCQKMGQKRALVAAVLVVTNCSDAFTQDVEDFGDAEPSTPFDSPEQARRAASAPTPQAQPQPKEAAPATAQQKIPPSMLSYYERIQKRPEVFVQVVTEIQDKMITQFGTAGDDGYMKVCEAFTKKYPNGTVDMRAFRDCLIDLNNEIERLEVIKQEQVHG